jgi:hypothetical protein
MIEIDPILPNIGNKGKLSANSIIFMSVICISLGLGLVKRNTSSRKDFTKISGPIQHFSSAIPIYPDKSKEGKFRWLKLYTNDRTFELFVGKDKDEFSPRIDHLDKLKEGDIIELYYEENNQTLKNPVNTLVEFIDYQGKVYYQNGNADKFSGYLIVGVSLILLFVGIYRKRKE